MVIVVVIIIIIIIIIMIVTVICIVYQGGRTALMKASEEGRKEVVELLLDHGADRDIQNQKEVSIIYTIACMYV